MGCMQPNNCVRMGLTCPLTWPGSNYESINGLTIYNSYSFVAQGSSISEVAARIYGVGGTGLDSDDLVCEIQTDDGSGKPSGTPVTNGTSATVNAVPTAAATVVWTFSPAASVTAGTVYWLVFKNAAADPTTNYYQLHWMSAMGEHASGQAGVPRKGRYTGSWAIAAGTAPWSGYRIKFGTGLILGIIQEGTYAGESTVRIYGAQEAGIKFTTPKHSRLVVRGVNVWPVKAGTPANALRVRLYKGSTSTPTLIATSPYTLNDEFIATERTLSMDLGAAWTLDPDTVYRVVLGVDTGGSSSNYYQLEYMAVHNTSDQLLVAPFGGTLAKTTTTDGTTFSDVAYHWPIFGLLLDPDSEFGMFANRARASSLGGSLDL